MVTPYSGLGFTSGRRTYLGNRLVGGVPNSDHLNGTAADFTASIPVLRARFGSKVKIIDEGDHRHVSGLTDVPFYGNRGTAGLVNGVDSSRPKETPMLNPRKPTQTTKLALNDVPYGIDESGALPTQMADFGSVTNTPTIKPKFFGEGGTGRRIVGILGDALMAAGGGQPVYAPLMERRREHDEESSLARERLNALIEERRQRAMEPPQFAQDAAYFNQLPREQQQSIIDYRNAMYPVTADVTAPDGSVTRSVMPRSLPGPQTQVVDGVTYYNINGEWYDNPEGR